MFSRITKKEKRKTASEPPDVDTNDLLPRLQVLDVSSSSKPDNYRVSPITPTSSSEKSPFEDWCGRGVSHVDFLPNESVPLTEGRFLGHGVNGGVFETTLRGQVFAWKRRYCKRQIGDAEKKEIEILKKVDHPHVIQLVGTYTHRQFLGLLLHPVAECDLAIFLEDMEALNEQQPLEPTRKARLANLGYDPEIHTSFRAFMGQSVFSQLGCLISAIDYLHNNKIRHKDLKPSNILLSKDRIWLTDFGSATDFSLLSISATDNGGGTPRYVAPEVATYKPSGRAADMFSLGCIILELLALHSRGSLKELKVLRPAKDGSYQANLERSSAWHVHIGVAESPRHRHLLSEVMGLLSPDPQKRPTANELCERLAFMDQSIREDSSLPSFRDCCRKQFLTMHEHERQMKNEQHSHWQETSTLRSQLLYEEESSQRKERELQRHQHEIGKLHYGIDHKTTEYLTERKSWQKKEREFRNLIEKHKEGMKFQDEQHQIAMDQLQGKLRRIQLEYSNVERLFHEKELEAEGLIEQQRMMMLDQNRKHEEDMTARDGRHEEDMIARDREHEQILERTYADFERHIGEIKEKVREAKESRSKKGVSSNTVSPDRG